MGGRSPTVLFCAAWYRTSHLDYAEMIILNASNLWKAAPAEQKQRLQQALFPEGVTYSDGNYRTALTCLLFSGMQMTTVQKEGLVALPGIEPGF
jgi:hypothetical protein